MDVLHHVAARHHQVTNHWTGDNQPGRLHHMPGLHCWQYCYTRQIEHEAKPSVNSNLRNLRKPLAHLGACKGLAGHRWKNTVIVSTQVLVAMAFRKLLVLAAVMLLAAPVVKSVPTDYVVSDEQSADVVPAADIRGCLVTEFGKLRDALENATASACVVAPGTAVIKLKCGADTIFNRGNGAKIKADPTITDWEVTTGCATAPIGINKLKDVTIDFAANPKFETEKVAVLKFETTAAGASFKMTHLNFIFKNKGVCSDTDGCAVINITGFKNVNITKVSMNTGAAAVPRENMPATGILIKNADAITLDRVWVVKMAESGIAVADGGAVTATVLKMNFNGKHGFAYQGCYERPSVAASLSLSSVGAGAFTFLSNNAKSGLFVDCDFGATTVPINIKKVTFGSNSDHGMWLRGTFNVTLDGVDVKDNGGAFCGGGIRAIMRNTATAKARLQLKGSKVTGNRAKYGAGICFQARYKLGDADADAPFALLKLSGVNQLLKNEATTCGGMMATIANMVRERIAIQIDKGTTMSFNKAGRGHTWCDVLDSPDDDTTGVDWQNFKPISFFDTEAE